MKNITYDRALVYEYAAKWAFERNPMYYSFNNIGGDCTNFASQCIFAGCGVMNFSPDGWYYTSVRDRSPSWTGVEFLYSFLTANRSYGPYAAETDSSAMEVGDIIQFSAQGDIFTHTLVVTHVSKLHSIYVAAHSQDAFNRPLSSYEYALIRYLHILGARNY